VRILYDGVLFSTPLTGGARRYFSNLISRLPPADEPWVTITKRPDDHFPTHPSMHVRRFPRFRPEKLSSIAERAYFRRIERRTKFDLAHPTYYYNLARRRLRNYRCPAVVTVHDMICELFWKGTAAGESETEHKRRAIADAQKVICISHHTKQDLVELFGVQESKIRVVYLATELSASMAAADASVPERPYFLYVGGHEAAYKNFDRLLRCMATVVARHSDVLLAVVGPPFTPTRLATIDALRLTQNVVHIGGVSDAHLAKLYNRSVALVYPSLYEGFGIPPLEAMACETAVITSNRSSIPEVVDNAAMLVDPESDEQLSAAMIMLLEDRSRREELIRLGRNRARHFSWDKMAAETCEIYREVVGR
jgi:glycosyltransferase involved in cell wall biosynthesis